MSQPFSYLELAQIAATGWRWGGQGWIADVPEVVAQTAALTHAEMATDRFCRQFSSVMHALTDPVADAHWTAVTCYYAAFFAAQALLLQVGRGAVRLPRALGLPMKGVFSIETSPSPIGVGQTEITLTSLSGNPHKQSWTQVKRLIDDVLAVEVDARPTVVLDTLNREIAQPNWLSDLRNEINYDVTSSPFASKMWSSLLTRIDDAERVEDELARSTQEKSERRFEIVAMALASLSAQLRSEHVKRGGRIDKRQKDNRVSLIPNHPWLAMAQ
jgi:hypothetical protein